MSDQQQTAGCVIGWLLILAVIGIVQLIVGGAWRTDLSYSLPGVEATTNLTPFEEKLNATHWVGGLVQGKDPDIQQAIGKHLGEGQRLTKLAITTKHTFLNNLLTVVTLGIYAPVTVVIRGEVGAAGQAPAPAAPPPAAPDTGR